MAREVRPDDENRAADGEEQAQPEGYAGAAAKEQPGEQSNDDGRAVAEDGGVGGSGAQDGSVVEGEIEGEE